MKLVILGAPGAGKGTQAHILTDYYNIVHISTGEILRDHMRRKTDIGIKISEFMNSGKLVSDDIVIEIFKQRIEEPDCKNGFLLDGFPRTVYQANILSDLVKDLNAVIEIDIDDKIIIERMAGRRVCPKCSKIYNIIYNKPKIDNKCDLCGTDLIQREDDKPKTVLSRLNIYHNQTKPLINYYRQQKLLISFDGTLPLKELSQKIIDALN